ncbi:hypothetical protein SDJN02_27259, partial [Cucurbita argyrosperma subsp. argyrosperma]
MEVKSQYRLCRYDRNYRFLSFTREIAVTATDRSSLFAGQIELWDDRTFSNLSAGFSSTE